MRAHRGFFALASAILAPVSAPAETVCFSFRAEITEIYRPLFASLGIPSAVDRGTEIRGRFILDIDAPGTPSDQGNLYSRGLRGITLEIAGVSSEEAREPGAVVVLDSPAMSGSDVLTLIGQTVFSLPKPEVAFQSLLLFLSLEGEMGDGLTSDGLPRTLDLSRFSSALIDAHTPPGDGRSAFFDARLTHLERCSQEAPFRRADASADGRVDISDVVLVLGFLFQGQEAPSCVDTADGNDDGRVNIADAVAIISSLFLGGDPLPAPGPGCGVDPTLDGLGCSAFPGCP